MMSAEEGERMGMSEVVDALTVQSPQAALPEVNIQPSPSEDLHILPIIHNTVLTRYDIPTGYWDTITLSTRLNLAMFCLLDASTVLCVGGLDSKNNALASAYLLDLMTARLVEVGAMHSTRYVAGLIKQGSAAYIFGGYDQDGVTLRACEKFVISAQVWVPLRDMQYQRHGFTPCIACDLIYLVSPEREIEGAIETFSVVTEEFKVLKTRIPRGLMSGNLAVFVVQGELYLLSENGQMATCNINTIGNFHISSFNRNNFGVYCSITPMLSNRQVFWSTDTGELRRFDLDSRTLTNQ